MTPARSPITLALAASLSLLLAAGAAEAAPQAGALTGQIRVKKDGKLKSSHERVVVYLEGVRGYSVRPGKTHEIRQRNQQFTPSVSVVTKGTRVAFPNDDRIFHNVFSTSRPARFDLGLYQSGTSKSVEFRRKGVVDVFCNIHPNMIARVLVVDTPFYDETDARGRFQIPGIPPGTYTAVIWQAYGPEVRRTITIEPGKVATLEAEVEEGERPRQHRRKDGTPYGRYE